MLPQKLFKRFSEILTNGRQDKEGKHCLDQFCEEKNPEWQKRFYALLREVIQYWGAKNAVCGVNHHMPAEYHLFYEKEKKEGTIFPRNNTYLDFPTNLSREERMVLGLLTEEDRRPGPQAQATLKKLKAKRIELTEMLFAEPEEMNINSINRVTEEYRVLGQKVDSHHVESKIAADYCRNPIPDIEDKQNVMIDLHKSYLNRNILEEGLDYSEDQDAADAKAEEERLAAEAKKKEEERKKIEEQKKEADKKAEEDRKRKELELKKKEDERKKDEEKKKKEAAEKAALEERKRKEKLEKEEQERKVKQEQDNAEKQKKKSQKSVRFKDMEDQTFQSPRSIETHQRVIQEVDAVLEDTPSKTIGMNLHHIAHQNHADEFDYSPNESFIKEHQPSVKKPATVQPGNLEGHSIEQLRKLRLDLQKAELERQHFQFLVAFKKNPGLKDNLPQIIQSQESQHSAAILALDLEEELNQIDHLKNIKSGLLTDQLEMQRIATSSVALEEREIQTQLDTLKETVSRLEIEIQAKKSKKKKAQEFLDSLKEKYRGYLMTSNSGSKVRSASIVDQSRGQLNKNTDVYRQLVWDHQEQKSNPILSAEDLFKKVDFSSFLNSNEKKNEAISNIQPSFNSQFMGSIGSASKFSTPQAPDAQNFPIIDKTIDNQVPSQQFFTLNSAFGEQLSKLLTIR